MGKKTATVVPIERIEKTIYLIRGQKVMLSMDLAGLYGVEPRALVQAVKRNADRFPDDFMFQLAPQEVADLKSQIVISSWGGPRSRPYAFTEQGVAMLSSVLRSDRAIDVNIAIMRTFVKLRQMLDTHSKLAQKLAELESKYDGQFQVVFEALNELMKPEDPPRKQIGFSVREARARYRTRPAKSPGGRALVPPKRRRRDGGSSRAATKKGR